MADVVTDDLYIFHEGNNNIAKVRKAVEVGPGIAPKEEQIDLADIPPDDIGYFGLGDLVEKGVKSLGLGKLAEIYSRITGKPCGCQTRKELLNRIKLWRR